MLLDDSLTADELKEANRHIALPAECADVKSRCTAHMLIPGDIIAMYADHDRNGEATIERPATEDEFTPAGHLTLWTTCGRYDVPSNARLGVIAWAPLQR
jgi:hypothetical protein